MESCSGFAGKIGKKNGKTQRTTLTSMNCRRVLRGQLHCAFLSVLSDLSQNATIRGSRSIPPASHPPIAEVWHAQNRFHCPSALPSILRFPLLARPPKSLAVQRHDRRDRCHRRGRAPGGTRATDARPDLRDSAQPELFALRFPNRETALVPHTRPARDGTARDLKDVHCTSNDVLIPE